MKYPKNIISEFVEYSEYDCRQVNLHIGRIYNYWFIEPNKHPYKLLKGELPRELIGKDIGKLKINN
jgi:hypothetical protein